MCGYGGIRIGDIFQTLVFSNGVTKQKIKRNLWGNPLQYEGSAAFIQ